MNRREIQKWREAARAAEAGEQTASAFAFPLQAKPALGHQNEKDCVGHAEYRAERDVRQTARRPVIKSRRGVGQFVERADEDQVGVPQQVAARDQGVGDANHQHERAEQRDVAAERRQFVADVQRREDARGKNDERQAKAKVVKGGDGEQSPIIFSFGGFHGISVY